MTQVKAAIRQNNLGVFWPPAFFRLVFTVHVIVYQLNIRSYIFKTGTVTSHWIVLN